MAWDADSRVGIKADGHLVGFPNLIKTVGGQVPYIEIPNAVHISGWNVQVFRAWGIE